MEVRRHHPEVSGPVAVLPNEMAPLDADACKLIQGNFRDDLHHRHRPEVAVEASPEVSAHRQGILERPVEVVEAHRQSLEVAAKLHHRVLHRVAYREFRGVAHRPTAEVAV